MLTFEQIEKDVMMYITRNSGKTCNIFEIFNDIVSDRNIKNPDLLKDLKIKLHIVLSQLDSTFNKVNVIKHNNNYLVCYNSNIDTTNITTETFVKVESKDIQHDDYENLSKSVFEYIVDNNIDYPIKPDCDGNTLLHIGFLLGDNDRINKLISKYNLSFFTKNKNNISVLDLITSNKDSLIMKYAFNEINTDMIKLKEENELLKKKNSDLSSIIVDINSTINNIKTDTKYTTRIDMFFTLSIMSIGVFLYYFK